MNMSVKWSSTAIGVVAKAIILLLVGLAGMWAGNSFADKNTAENTSAVLSAANPTTQQDNTVLDDGSELRCFIVPDAVNDDDDDDSEISVSMREGINDFLESADGDFRIYVSDK